MDLLRVKQLLVEIRVEMFENQAGYLNNFDPFLELEDMVDEELKTRAIEVALEDAPDPSQDDMHEVPF